MDDSYSRPFKKLCQTTKIVGAIGFLKFGNFCHFAPKKKARIERSKACCVKTEVAQKFKFGKKGKIIEMLKWIMLGYKMS